MSSRRGRGTARGSRHARRQLLQALADRCPGRHTVGGRSRDEDRATVRSRLIDLTPRPVA